MRSPLSGAPIDTPASVVETAFVLAWAVFPALFLFVCLLMLLARVRRPPYFAYLCAFACLGSMSLSIATANSPLSALSFLVAFPITPLLMIWNLSRLRSHPKPSIFHRGAQWTSVLSITVILSLLVWTMFDWDIYRK